MAMSLSFRAMILLVGVSAVFAGAAPSANYSTSGPACSDYMIPVSIGSGGKSAPVALRSRHHNARTVAAVLADEPLFDGVGDTLQSLLVSGTFEIAARYCEPEVVVQDRQDSVQLLVHGITYDKNYWSGGDYPVGFNGDEYSWIAYASKLGYPTLSIDRLGCGNSSHPDPTFAVQIPTQIEAYHQVIQALRNGDIGGRKFSKVAYVGHSYGSVMGNTLTAKYPEDVDALILTGYSRFLKPSVPGVIITPLLLPAALVSPRFSQLNLGYLAMSNKAGRASLLFSNDQSEYDAELIDFDYARMGTVTSGEAVSALFINRVAENYTNPVMVITGHQDQIFCGLSVPALGEASCRDGAENQMAQTQTLYPNAEYSYLDVPATGHSLNFFYSANVTFSAAHKFLASAGL